jgi:hypothetical protein
MGEAREADVRVALAVAIKDPVRLLAHVLGGALACSCRTGGRHGRPNMERLMTIQPAAKLGRHGYR